MVSTSSTLYEINRILKKACEINVVKPILDPPDCGDINVEPWLLNLLILEKNRKDCHRSHQNTHILKNGYQTHSPCSSECV